MICGVIGQPISHSASPRLHRAAYAWLGLDWQYRRCEVAADQVADFVAGLSDDWRGVSVTMPCKPAAAACGHPDGVVAALGVANTILFDGHPGDVDTTRVANTDVPGIQGVLAGQGFDAAGPVTVWGNGATATSCLYALAQIGVTRASLRARDDAKTAALARRAVDWGIDVVVGQATGGTLISTVPAGVASQWLTDLVAADLVVDVIYDPWPTPLAEWADRRGTSLATGLDLLAAQAVGQVELMTGRIVPLTVLRQAARSAK